MVSCGCLGLRCGRIGVRLYDYELQCIAIVIETSKRLSQVLLWINDNYMKIHIMKMQIL